ncbi:heat shock protein HSP20 family protein [Ceratobasidium sp. AG-Ba]|nr:heat shock protein HSP20 family protein [Ceratobasidium sp. AG-Ba]
MSLSRTFFNEFRPLFRMLEDPFFTSPFYPATRSARFSPNDWSQRQAAVEMSEEGNEFVIQAEMPGVKKENLDVQLGDDGRSLTIQGHVHKVNKALSQPSTPGASSDSAKDNSTTDVVKSNADQTPAESEFRSSFTRTLWLPQPVDANKAKAELSDGVLTLRIPKREQAEALRIAIN